MNPLTPADIKMGDLPNTSERDFKSFVDEKITLWNIFDNFNTPLDFSIDPMFPVQQIGCYLMCLDDGLNLNSWVYRFKPSMVIEILKRVMTNIELTDPTKAIPKVMKVI